MLDNIFTATTPTTEQILLCTGVSLALGLVIGAVYMFRNAYNRGFVAMLVLLPAIVQAVILLVNGNLGVGIAVMGAFNLVRFRSVPGSAREIGTIFLAMAVGLAAGMGYLGYAAVFTGIISVAMLILNSVRAPRSRNGQMRLRVTIPENLNYSGLLDDLFHTYTRTAELEQVRTTNMGSLYELQYRIVLKDANNEKELIDAIRCRNGNLSISCGLLPSMSSEL